MSRIDLGAGLGVLVVDGQTHGDLERSRIGHAALFALSLVVLELQTHRVAALVAEVGSVLVVGAALRAEHIAGMERVGDDHVAAVDAGGAQVMQALQVAALALPVADGVVDEIELRDIAEIGNGKDRGEDGLQTVVFALGWQLVHLQKAFVGAALNFNQVGNLDRCRNFGKIETAAKRAVLVRHASLLKTRRHEAPAEFAGGKDTARVTRHPLVMLLHAIRVRSASFGKTSRLFLLPAIVNCNAAGISLARKATRGVGFRFAQDNPLGQASVPAE